MKRFRHFAIAFTLMLLGTFASAQQQLGQWCHNNRSDLNFGLYCTTINATFVAQKGTNYATSIETLNGVTTPITGTLTFAPGPDVVLNQTTDVNGNPVCYQLDSNGNAVYDSNGNPVEVPCPVYKSYDITRWDITIGPTHLYYDANNPFPVGDPNNADPTKGSNSGCGTGYGTSSLKTGNATVYVLCGDNTDTASTGTIVLLVPTVFLRGGKNNGYTALLPQVQDQNGFFWQTGLYMVDQYGNSITPAGSAVAALDPPSKPHGSGR